MENNPVRLLKESLCREEIFLMGATAFALFGGELDRSREKWQLNEATYQVALKAVSPDRGMRYPSISAVSQAWKTALQQEES